MPLQCRRCESRLWRSRCGVVDGQVRRYYKNRSYETDREPVLCVFVALTRRPYIHRSVIHLARWLLFYVTRLTLRWRVKASNYFIQRPTPNCVLQTELCTLLPLRNFEIRRSPLSMRISQARHPDYDTRRTDASRENVTRINRYRQCLSVVSASKTCFINADAQWMTSIYTWRERDCGTAWQGWIYFYCDSSFWGDVSTCTRPWRRNFTSFQNKHYVGKRAYRKWKAKWFFGHV